MEPWKKYTNIWKSESDYWNWMRGNFRRIWSRYPVKLEFKKNNSYPPPPDYKGRAKKMGTCALCGEKNVPISHLEVDHIHQVGSFDSKESAFDWFWNLLCEESNMQLVHKECHKIKSYADKNNISFKEAQKQKFIIKLIKNKQEKKWLNDHNIEPSKNIKERKKQILDTINKLDGIY